MEITAEIIADFRDYYPEFADVEQWPKKDVLRALEEGDSETGRRWLSYTARPASIKKRGMFAFAAHKLVMWRRARGEDGTGGDYGTAYAISGKSVGDESTSFAVPSVTGDELIINGDLPLTSYGLEFLRLRRRAGTGAIAL